MGKRPNLCHSALWNFRFSRTPLNKQIPGWSGAGCSLHVPSPQAQRHSTTVLSAMMAGMDDKEDLDDEITLEAMGGLSRILAQIDETHIRAILINIALRIRPCFEKVGDARRTLADNHNLNLDFRMPFLFVGLLHR